MSTNNYEARKFGIKAGIPISCAKKLKPDAIFLPINMELYRSISDEVMEILRGYCEVLKKESVDEAFCGITGKVSDFEVVKLLAVKIKKDLTKADSLLSLE